MGCVLRVAVGLAVFLSWGAYAKKPAPSCPVALKTAERLSNFAVRFPSLFEETMQLRTALLDVRALRREFPSWSPERILKKGFDLRDREAERLRSLAHRAKHSFHAPDLVVAELERAADQIQMSRDEYEKHRLHIQDRSFDSAEVGETMQTVRATVAGVEGEMEFFFLLPGVVARGVFVRDLPDAAVRLRGLPQRFGDKEIDIIFNDGKSWAEVKNKRLLVERITEDSSDAAWRAHRKVVDQATDTALVAERFGVEHHIFFRHGIREDAAVEFQRMGARVHGIVKLVTPAMPTIRVPASAIPALRN